MADVARAVLSLTTDPSGLRAGLSEAQRITDTSAKRIETTLKHVGAALAGAFSVGAVLNAGKQVLETTGAIQDAADKIGISAEAVQRLGFAASQGGSSIESVGRSIKFMADQLQNPSSGARAGMDALGLSIDELRAMSPDKAFTTIADAIAKVPDPLLQSAYANDLLGKSGVELLPAIKSGFVEIGNQAPIMSNAVVKAGDDAGDKLALMQSKMDTLKAQALVPLIDTFTKLPDGVQVAMAGVMEMGPAFSQIGIAIMAAGGPKEAIKVLKDSLKGLGTLLTLPAGAVALAILGLIAIWQNWDTIGPIVANVYETVKTATGQFVGWLTEKFDSFLGFFRQYWPALLGPAGIAYLAWKQWGDDVTALVMKTFTAVKTWLVDKFVEIVNGVKAKIEAVTGFFRNMYDKVVGQSYVPDMIARIASEFAKLDGAMVGRTRQATEATAGLFNTLTNQVGSILQGLAPKVASAFQSGMQAASGFARIFAGDLTGLKDAVVGTWNVIKGIGSGIADFFKGIFGGPSKEEKEGRGVAAQFREQLEGMLSDTQKLEAGNERWKQSVIVVRDAYIAAGRTEQEALDIMQRLWAAEKKGGSEVKRVIEEIERTMRGGLTLASRTFGDTFLTATQTAENGLIALGATAQVIKDTIAQPITIPILVEWHGLELSRASERAEAEGMTDEQKRNLISGFLASNAGHGGSGDDRHRIPSALGIPSSEAERLGFSHGTPGLDFVNFKAGTPVTLHGLEAVVLKGLERAFAARHGLMDTEGIDRLDARLATLERLFRDLPFTLRQTVKHAVATA